jgi:hypothetical protein
VYEVQNVHSEFLSPTVTPDTSRCCGLKARKSVGDPSKAKRLVARGTDLRQELATNDAVITTSKGYEQMDSDAEQEGKIFA